MRRAVLLAGVCALRHRRSFHQLGHGLIGSTLLSMCFCSSTVCAQDHGHDFPPPELPHPIDGPVQLHGHGIEWDVLFQGAEWSSQSEANSNNLPVDHRVGWLPVKSENFPLPDFIQEHLIKGGHNTKPDKDLYLCRANLSLNGQYEGLQVGKLIDNNCNVSFGDWGGQTHDFQIALWFGHPGYWAGGSDYPGPMLVAGRDDDHAPLLACSSNWQEQKPLGNVDDHGRQIGKWVHGNSCEFEYGDKRESPNQDVEFYHLADEPPPCPAGFEGIYPNCHREPHKPDDHLSSCQVPAHLMACKGVLAPTWFPGDFKKCEKGYRCVAVYDHCDDDHSFDYPRTYCERVR